MPTLGAETAPFPRKNALRKTPGKPVIRKIRTFSVGHESNFARRRGTTFFANSQREYPTGNCDSERYHRRGSLTDNLIFVRKPAIPLQPLVIHRIELLGAEASIN